MRRPSRYRHRGSFHAGRRRVHLTEFKKTHGRKMSKKIVYLILPWSNTIGEPTYFDCCLIVSGVYTALSDRNWGTVLSRGSASISLCLTVKITGNVCFVPFLPSAFRVIGDWSRTLASLVYHYIYFLICYQRNTCFQF